VEDVHAGVGEDAAYVLLRVRFEVVIAQHGDDRHLRRAELARENPRFFRKPVVGEVAAQQQRVGRVRRLREQLAECAGRILLAMEVADGGEADVVLREHSVDLLVAAAPLRSQSYSAWYAACVVAGILSSV